MSEQQYKEFKSLINPHGLPRGRGKYHLDHKFPIIEGFLRSIPPATIAHHTNLQMLLEFDNVSKGRKLGVYQ